MKPLASDITGEVLRQAQTGGLAITEIAARVGLSQTTVRGVLERHGVSTAWPGSVSVLHDPGGDYATGARFHVADLYLGMLEIDGALAWNDGMQFYVTPFRRCLGGPYTATVTDGVLIRQDTGQRLEPNGTGGVSGWRRRGSPRPVRAPGASVPARHPARGGLRPQDDGKLAVCAHILVGITLLAHLGR